MSVVGLGDDSAGWLGGWEACGTSCVLVLGADGVLLPDLLNPALILAAGLLALAAGMVAWASSTFGAPSCWIACCSLSSASFGVRLSSLACVVSLTCGVVSWWVELE